MEILKELRKFKEFENYLKYINKDVHLLSLFVKPEYNSIFIMSCVSYIANKYSIGIVVDYSSYYIYYFTQDIKKLIIPFTISNGIFVICHTESHILEDVDEVERNYEKALIYLFKQLSEK